jgi:hypothetical protein
MYASYAALLPHVCSNAYSFADIFLNAHDAHPSVFANASRFAISSSNRARTPASVASLITNSFLASYGASSSPGALALVRVVLVVPRPRRARACVDVDGDTTLARIVVVIVIAACVAQCRALH